MSGKLKIAVPVAVALLLVTTAVATGAVTAGNTGWNWGNPRPQGNTLSALDAVGARTYAGGLSGTLLRSDDSGATWTTVRTGILDEVSRVRAVDADVLIFSGGCALRRSDDGGATVKRLPWTPSDEACSPTIRSFSFPSSQVGYLLLANGDVFATTDGGNQWAKKSAVPGTAGAAGGGTATPGDIWFTADGTGVSAAGGNIYRTTDGATSWSLVNNVATGALNAFSFSNANNGMVVGKSKNVLTTSDGGATWTAANIAVGAGGIELGKVDCFNPNKCVVGASDGSALFYTSDGGGSWAVVSPLSAGAFAFAYNSGSHLTAVGGLGGTVVSDDGGATWSTVGGGVAGAYFGLNIEAATTAYAYGDNGVLARTTDGGLTWSALNAPSSTRIVDASFPTAGTGYVLDEVGKLLRSTNGGASWGFLDTGSSARPQAMVSVDPNAVVLIGPKGIRRSDDAGGNFGPAKGKKLSKHRLDSYDKAGSALIAFGSKSLLLSADKGKTWKALPLPRKSTVFIADFVSAKVGYLLDGRDEVWVTRNSGKKWKRLETTGAVDFESMAWGDAKHGYLSDNTGRVLYTADGGKTWSRQYPFFDDNGNSSLTLQAAAGTVAFGVVDGSNRFFSTTTGGQIGKASVLSIKSSAKKVKRNATIKVTGKLSPALGGEKVTVFARAIGAKNGAGWTAQEATVSTSGTFTTTWKIKRPMIFVSRWSGDADNDGDGAPAVLVKLKR